MAKSIKKNTTGVKSTPAKKATPAVKSTRAKKATPAVKFTPAEDNFIIYSEINTKLVTYSNALEFTIDESQHTFISDATTEAEAKQIIINFADYNGSNFNYQNI